MRGCRWWRREEVEKGGGGPVRQVCNSGWRNVEG